MKPDQNISHKDVCNKHHQYGPLCMFHTIWYHRAIDLYKGNIRSKCISVSVSNKRKIRLTLQKQHLATRFKRQNRIAIQSTWQKMGLQNQAGYQ